MGKHINRQGTIFPQIRRALRGDLGSGRYLPSDLGESTSGTPLPIKPTFALFSIPYPSR